MGRSHCSHGLLGERDKVGGDFPPACSGVGEMPPIYDENGVKMGPKCRKPVAGRKRFAWSPVFRQVGEGRHCSHGYPVPWCQTVRLSCHPCDRGSRFQRHGHYLCERWLPGKAKKGRDAGLFPRRKLLFHSELPYAPPGRSGSEAVLAASEGQNCP